MPQCLFSAQIKTHLNVYNIIGQQPVHVFTKNLTFPSTLKMLVLFGKTLWKQIYLFSSCDMYKFVTVPKQMLLCDESDLDMFIFSTAYLHFYNVPGSVDWLIMRTRL